MVLIIALFISLTNAQTFDYTSPNGITESCVILERFPNSAQFYSSKDREKEKEYCSLDFYNEAIALCPKTWSTSPATMVYDLSKQSLSQKDYEETKCTSKKGHDKLVKFKQTMNQSNTSGTFSPSSLLYYHFSRYFNFTINVPVAVLRTMDKEQHLKRVSERGVELTSSYRSSSRIKSGWLHLKDAEINPSSYRPTRELFTDDEQKVYGVLLRGKGERYGAEFNGVRDGWGRQDNLDFQKTYPFLALKHDNSLLKSLETGRQLGAHDKRMSRASGDVSSEQMLYWMKELLEITLVDYIFSQQDRIGNIDYIWYWQWKEDGKIKTRKVSQESLKDLARTKKHLINVPQDLVKFSPKLLQRGQLNDNDAGGRVQYANFTKKTKMLEGLKHYNSNLYRKLIDLDKDLQVEGPIYDYLHDHFMLDKSQLGQIVKNVSLAREILQNTCVNKELRFDIEPEEFFLQGFVKEQEIDCY